MEAGLWGVADSGTSRKLHDVPGIETRIWYTSLRECMYFGIETRMWYDLVGVFALVCVRKAGKNMTFP